MINFIILMISLAFLICVAAVFLGPETVSAIIFIGPIVIIYGGIFAFTLITMFANIFNILYIFLNYILRVFITI